MIQGIDREIIAGMIGNFDFTEALEDEYVIRARMLHVVGGGTSLGYLGLIDLCRHCGIGPKTIEPRRVQWTDVANHSRVRVQHSDGRWLEGVYLGSPATGYGAVRLDGQTHVNEFPLRTIEQVDSLQDTEEEADRKDQISVSDPPTPVAALADAKDAAVEDLAEMWLTVAPGAKVLIAAGSETIEAEFASIDYSREGCLTVRINDKPMTVPVEDVVLASEVEV